MSLGSALDRVRGSKFLRDVVTLQASGVLIQGSQFVSSVAIAYLLGARGQGAFNVALMLQALTFFVVSVGLVPATVSQVAAASARGLDDKVTQWLAFLLKAVLLFSLLIFAVGYVVLPTAGERFYADRELGVWAWWLTAMPLLDLPRWIAVVAFQGTRRMRALGAMDNGQELLRAFLVILGALLTGSARGAVLGMIAGTVLTNLIAIDLYVAARRDGGSWLPGLKDLLAHVRDVPLRQGMRLGVRVGLVKNTNVMVLTILPRLMIGAAADMEWVAYFHIAQRIMGLPLTLMQGVTRTMLPALSELKGVRDPVAFRRLWTRVTFAGGGLIAAAVLACLPFVKPVVGLVFPADYAEPVFVNAAILALGFVPFAFALALEPFYVATARLRVALTLTIVGGVLTIPTNVLLVWAFPHHGAAWGIALYMSWVLVHLAYVTTYFRRSRAGEVAEPAEAAGPS